MTPTPNQPDAEASAKRDAAVEIVAETFSAGLAEICNPHFLAKRYSEFLSRDDPIYVNLLQGMNDDPLSKTFVSYWTIAQTLATQSRFWLEDAVAEIITSQVKQFGRHATHVYSQRMLSHRYMEQYVTVADLGEKYKEHLTDRRSWRPEMKANALKEADVLVGEQERERINAERRQKPFLRRTWDEAEGGEATARDIAQLKRMADAVSGDAINDVAIQCNLLVIEPDKDDGKPHAFAIRFINSKTIASHAQRKQERVNLLRLYAYLVQEKVFRAPTAIHVCVAELIPRIRSDFDQYDHHPDYFSAHTYWPAESLWKFIGVPFDVVSEAVRRVGREFRDQLKEGLRFLLPESEAPEKWGEPQRGRKKSRGTKQAAAGGLFPAGEIEPERDRMRFLALMQKWHADHPRADQVRHCENVARLLEHALDLESAPNPVRRNMLLAALGHDLYEDSKITASEIIGSYGPEVHLLIRTLTEGSEGVPAYVDQGEQTEPPLVCSGGSNEPWVGVPRTDAPQIAPGWNHWGAGPVAAQIAMCQGADGRRLARGHCGFVHTGFPERWAESP